MRTQFSKFALAATFGLAMAFTFSCSSDKDDDSSGGGGGSGCPNATVGDNTLTCGGQTYKTVKIGEQVWMAENLNYKAKGSKCYAEGVDGVSADSIAKNCSKYGRLYSWATAMGIDAKYNSEWWEGSDVKHRGICPSGWHLPSEAEWDNLRYFVNDYDGGNTGRTNAGKKLKATSGWNDYNGRSGNGTDDYGFSALPSGGGNFGWWWSASAGSKHSDRAYYRQMTYDDPDVFNYDRDKASLCSVRCVQD